jgi:hypothetical protein
MASFLLSSACVSIRTPSDRAAAGGRVHEGAGRRVDIARIVPTCLQAEGGS